VGNNTVFLCAGPLSNNVCYFYSTIGSTSSSTGALVLSGGLGVAGNIFGGGSLYGSSNSFLIGTKGTLANGAGSQTGALTNAPASGNPSKWIAIDDNGTTRYIPTWL
jgi:hypothetical protein